MLREKLNARARHRSLQISGTVFVDASGVCLRRGKPPRRYSEPSIPLRRCWIAISFWCRPPLFRLLIRRLRSLRGDFLAFDCLGQELRRVLVIGGDVDCLAQCRFCLAELLLFDQGFPQSKKARGTSRVDADALRNGSGERYGAHCTPKVATCRSLHQSQEKRPKISPTGVEPVTFGFGGRRRVGAKPKPARDLRRIAKLLVLPVVLFYFPRHTACCISLHRNCRLRTFGPRRGC
jgi:hypothetical protein